MTTLSLPQGNKGNMRVYRKTDSQDNLSLETCSAISLCRIARKYIRHHDCNVNCDSTRILRRSFKSICTHQFYRTRPLKLELVQPILRRSWCRKRDTNMMFTLHFRFKSIQLWSARSGVEGVPVVLGTRGAWRGYLLVCGGFVLLFPFFRVLCGLLRGVGRFEV